MKVHFIAKRFALALLLAPAMGIQGTGYMTGNSCPPINCEYPPFECGAFDIEVKAGVAPKLWAHDKDRLLAVNPNITPAQGGPVVSTGKLPKFHCLFKLPWIVGIRVGWFLSCNIETYLEFDYIQAHAKCFSFDVPVKFDFKESKLKELSGYLGGRFYFNRWFCNTTSWFIGAKVGITHHDTQCFGFGPGECKEGANCPPSCSRSSRSNDCNRAANRDQFFRKHTSVAGGIHTGFNVCFGCGFSFVVTAEIVAGCGPHGNQNIVVAGTGVPGVTNLGIGSIGTELTFPVTFGIQYTF